MERLKEGRVAGFPASSPTPPPRTRAGEREVLRRQALYREAEAVERRRQLRGLLWLALLILAASVARAGAQNVFPRGWWRLW
jgi:hypothetical protein